MYDSIMMKAGKKMMQMFEEANLRSLIYFLWFL